MKLKKLLKTLPPDYELVHSPNGWFVHESTHSNMTEYCKGPKGALKLAQTHFKDHEDWKHYKRSRET